MQMDFFFNDRHIVFAVENDQNDVGTKLNQTTKTDCTTTANEIISENCGKLDDIEATVLRSNDKTTAGTTPVKSCLSRHNSMHTSIKKKVNISTQAEIIEPDPAPQSPHEPVSSNVDDDDVFSDSLPPPKRESMCAPYIEQTDVPELVAYAHGLPEWFNDERINEIGCIEPPVTPVGRDELELRRQRLYTDLLHAAHAAVEHNVRFTSFATNITGDAISRISGSVRDCDPDLKPSVAENLEKLVNRLEQLVERLEHSISARELEVANRTIDAVRTKKRESFNLERTELPTATPTELLPLQTESINNRIEKLEHSLYQINERHSSSLSTSNSQCSQKLRELQEHKQQKEEDSLENIPTVLEDYQVSTLLPVSEGEQYSQLKPPSEMSVLGFQNIISGPLNQYLALSEKIGGDVAKHAQLVKLAFE
uniref:Uncharacterized protein n=1 Tax=Bactrocera latifrons TaxID=174628 RepID=A0A0K8U322_BACLA